MVKSVKEIFTTLFTSVSKVMHFENGIMKVFSKKYEEGFAKLLMHLNLKNDKKNQGKVRKFYKTD